MVYVVIGNKDFSLKNKIRESWSIQRPIELKKSIVQLSACGKYLFV